MFSIHSHNLPGYNSQNFFYTDNKKEKQQQKDPDKYDEDKKNIDIQLSMKMVA